MNTFRHIVLSLVFLAGACLMHSPAQAAPSLEEQLVQLFREHPEIVLDVLKKHSAEVLDIVQEGSDNRRRTALLKQWETDLQQPKHVSLEGCPAFGTPNMPVTIVAYSDFLCSYCRQAAFTIGNLLNKYKGRIRLVCKQTPKSDAGNVAGAWFLAAYKLDRDKARKFYATLYDRQQKVEDDTIVALRAIAGEVGYDVKALEAEVNGNAKKYEDMINADAAEARSLGFAGTPYFLVNDLVIRGAVPLDNFIDAVELALKHAKK